MSPFSALQPLFQSMGFKSDRSLTASAELGFRVVQGNSCDLWTP